MEATKYIRAFEDFAQNAGEEEAEITPQATVDKIWKAIDSGEMFGIISSYGPGNDTDVNKEDFGQLKRDVLKLKYGYLEQAYSYYYNDGDGATNVKRKSLFVPELHRKNLMALAKKYGQPVVAFGSDRKMQVLRVSDGAVLKTINFADMKLSWNLLISDQNNIPW